MKTIFAISTLLATMAAAYHGDLTWYDPGLGACGDTDNDNSMIVSVPIGIYGNDANPNNAAVCHKTVTITCPNGATLVGAIEDKCQGCGPEDLDVSPAVFQHCAALSVGRLAVDWVIN